MQKIKAILALKKLYDDEIKKNGKEAVSEVIKEFLDKYSCLYAVRWSQLLSSCNDNNFFIDDFLISFEKDRNYFSLGNHNDHDISNYDQIVKDLRKMKKIFPDSLLRAIFGSDKMITITRDSMTIESDYYEL